jgi:nucleoside-triphosphatase THEP1
MDDDLPLVAALIRRKDNREVFARLAEHAKRAGLGLVGMVQQELPHPGRTSPDRILVDLDGGAPIDITEERGDGATACHLHVQALEEAVGRLIGRLDVEPLPDLMIVSKFAAVEIDGHGFRQAVERAVERGVPVLVGVTTDHLPGFRAFADGLEVVFEDDGEAFAFVDRLARGAATAA